MMKRDAGSTFYIVTPSCNCVQYIDETILSVVTQAGDFSIRYHIQDGGSTDGTIDKIKAWEERLRTPGPWVFCDSVTFSWDSSPDNGMYDAVNKGFERLHIPPEGIMAWMNADDIYMQYAFSSVARAFSDLPEMQWFGGGVASLFAHDVLVNMGYDRPYPRELIQNYCCDDQHWRVIAQSGQFWRMSLWRQAGPLDQSLRYAGDYALWPKFAQHAELYQFATIVGLFRYRPGQLSANAAYAVETEKICSSAKRKQYYDTFLQITPSIKAMELHSDSSGKFSAQLVPVVILPRWKKFLKKILPDQVLYFMKWIYINCCTSQN